MLDNNSSGNNLIIKRKRSGACVGFFYVNNLRCAYKVKKLGCLANYYSILQKTCVTCDTRDKYKEESILSNLSSPMSQSTGFYPFIKREIQ